MLTWNVYSLSGFVCTVAARDYASALDQAREICPTFTEVIRVVHDKRVDNPQWPNITTEE